jgi:MFS family permease
MLIIFRLMQGVGGCGLQPSEQAIPADTFPPETAPGSGTGTTTRHTYALLQSNVLNQANMLAYIENFWVLGTVMAYLNSSCVFD